MLEVFVRLSICAFLRERSACGGLTGCAFFVLVLTGLCLIYMVLVNSKSCLFLVRAYVGCTWLVPATLCVFFGFLFFRW